MKKSFIRISHKVLALMLSAALVLCMLPATAVFAAMGEQPDFTINDKMPIQTRVVTVPAGQTVEFDVGAASYYHMIIESEEITVTFGATEYQSQNGVVDVFLNKNAISVQFSITNHAVVDKELSLKFSRHEGHKDLPIVLEQIGDFWLEQKAAYCNNMDVGTFYSWTAPTDGILNMKVTGIEAANSGMEPLLLVEVGDGQYEAKNGAVSVKVRQGDKVKIQLAAIVYGVAFDANISVSASFGDEIPAPGVLDVFVDINPEAWYYDSLEYMVDSGYMKGMSATEMAPNGTLTRAQWAKILYEVAGAPQVFNMVEPFDDVSEEQWFYNAVVWAFNEGIVNGIDKDTFGHNSNITREQMATMLFRFAKAEKVSGNLNAFADSNEVGGYAVDALVWATQNGIINGLSATTLAPRGTATRAQAAKILFVYLSMQN